jgi:hypothetical protein
MPSNAGECFGFGFVYISGRSSFLLIAALLFRRRCADYASELLSPCGKPLPAVIKLFKVSLILLENFTDHPLDVAVE